MDIRKNFGRRAVLRLVVSEVLFSLYQGKRTMQKRTDALMKQNQRNYAEMHKDYTVKHKIAV